MNYNKNTYFTSDLHFGHSNIIKYCDRPYKNVIDMNKDLIERWNNKVPTDAHIFILGDFFFKSSKASTRHILKSLNGLKHLIIGNHDKYIKKDWFSGYFESINGLKMITVNDNELNDGAQGVVLCHYPMMTWNQKHRGVWQLYGHLHSTPTNVMRNGMNPSQYDVGVDKNNFTPLSYEEVKIIITKQHLNNSK